MFAVYINPKIRIRDLSTGSNLPIIKCLSILKIEYLSRRNKLLVFYNQRSFGIWNYVRNRRESYVFNSPSVTLQTLDLSQTRLLGHCYHRGTHNLIWRRLFGVTKQSVFGSSMGEPVHVGLPRLTNHHRVLYTAYELISYNPISQKRKRKLVHRKQQYWRQLNFVVIGSDFLGLIESHKMFVVGAVDLQIVCEIRLEYFTDTMLFAQKLSQLVYYHQKTIHCVDWRLISRRPRPGKACQTRWSGRVSFQELIGVNDARLVKRDRFARTRDSQSVTAQPMSGASSLKRVSNAATSVDRLGSGVEACGDSQPDSASGVTSTRGEIPKYSRLLRVGCDQRLQHSEGVGSDWDSSAGTHYRLGQLVRFQRLRRAHAVYHQTARRNRSTLEILTRKATDLSRLTDQVRRQQLDNYRLTEELLSLQIEAQRTSASPDSHPGETVGKDCDIFVED